MFESNYDKRVITLFLPAYKIMKYDEGYKMFEKFNNLSKHVFKHEEIDFLCDCYHSGIYSLIGGTNPHGERRLTIPGICGRYRINSDVLKKWLLTYKRKMRLIIKTRINTTISNRWKVTTELLRSQFDSKISIAN